MSKDSYASRHSHFYQTCSGVECNNIYKSGQTEPDDAMTDTAVSIPEAEIEALEQLYTFRGRTEVLQFLEQYPFLVPVLLEAPEKIRHYFPDSQLFLEVSIDPEIIDYVQLVLSILMKLDPDEAVDRLHQLDKDWSWGLSHQVHQQFFTTLEYPDEF